MPHDRPVDRRSTTTSLTAFVIVGGDPLPALTVAAVARHIAAGVAPGLAADVAASVAAAATVVIAADSGLDHALAAGIHPTIVVGDFDSVSAAGLEWARRNAVEIHQHPPAKDNTDTELALATAVAGGATDIVMLSGGGDRLDHSIAALTALGHSSLASLRSVSALWFDSTVHVLHGPRTFDIELPLGTTFSLVALHGRCTGVGEIGAEWPLSDAVIEPGSSLGISNVSVAPTVTVSVETGVLTLIIPAHTALVAPSPAGLQ